MTGCGFANAAARSGDEDDFGFDIRFHDVVFVF